MTTAMPPLDEPYPLARSTVEDFTRQGHVLIAGLVSPSEVEAYRPVIEATALATAFDKRPLAERDTYGKAFLQSFNLWRVDDRIATMVLSHRLARVAADLLGVDRVRLYHDQALFKEPGGGRTPWHQDQYYWPMDTDATITLWMPLVDVPAEIGSMTFVTGSHRMGDLRGKAISDESDAEFAALITERNLACHSYGALGAGDATFHSGWTVHSAGPNPTDQLRSVMTVIYVADGARVGTAMTAAQDLDRQLWLGGIAPGTVIGSELNPLLG